MPVRIQVPRAFEFLYKGPARIRAAYGGRGSGKSWAFAQALVLKGARQPLRVLCCGEIQHSIRDSVKRLIEDMIVSSGLSAFYHSTDSEIRGKNGTLFLFAGVRTNPDSIKSMEGLDIAWGEECALISQRSLDLIIPTLRKPGSELWFTWNPRLATDPIDKLLRDPKGLPPNAIVKRVNYDDNPWFPDVLRTDMEFDRQRDPDKYAHVWLGEYVRNSEARVFKNWVIEEFETPDRATFDFGADWGFSVDPSVLIRTYSEGRTLYIDHEAYAVGCDIDHTPALFAGDFSEDLFPPGHAPKGGWENPKHYKGIPGATRWELRADSARPETISYMQRKNFNVVPANKGVGSVEEGVTFMQSMDIKVHPRCKHTIDELTMFSWKVDPQTSLILPVLVDKKNHVIDACRYALERRRAAFKGWGAFELARQEADTLAAAALAASAGKGDGIVHAPGSMEAMMAMN